MRTTISSSVPAHIAERISDVDDLSTKDQILIETRAEQIIADRLLDQDEVKVLIDDIDATTHISRAVANLDRAIAGDQIARYAVFTALSHIQRDIKASAHQAWLDDARAQAEQELFA